MPWAYFQNLAAWTTFNDAVCTDKTIPRPGRRQSDQAPMILNCWTDAWVQPIQLRSQGNVTTWAAHITDAEAVQYAAVLGIVVPDSQVVFNANGTVTVQGTTYTQDPLTLTWKKTKPATYTIDGVTYNTTTGLPV